MEKSRNYVVFGVLALVVSLVAVSLAYAGFTQTLTFNGSGTVKGGKWDVHLTNATNLVFSTVNSNNNLNYNDVTITHSASGTNPALSGTVVGTYSVTLATPGDRAEFTFQTVNVGNWDAKLQSVTLGAISCTLANSYTGTNDNYGDLTSSSTFSCDDALRIELFDVTSSEVLVADNSTRGLAHVNGSDSTYVDGVTLGHHTGTRTYKIRITYLDKNNSSITPNADVTIDMESTVFTYVQTGTYHESAA